MSIYVSFFAKNLDILNANGISRNLLFKEKDNQPVKASGKAILGGGFVGQLNVYY